MLHVSLPHAARHLTDYIIIANLFQLIVKRNLPESIFYLIIVYRVFMKVCTHNIVRVPWGGVITTYYFPAVNEVEQGAVRT